MISKTKLGILCFIVFLMAGCPGAAISNASAESTTRWERNDLGPWTRLWRIQTPDGWLVVGHPGGADAGMVAVVISDSKHTWDWK